MNFMILFFVCPIAGVATYEMPAMYLDTVQSDKNEIADVGARPSLRAARDPEDLRVALLASLQRRWGMIAARANAQLLLDRLTYVGSGALAAAARRSTALTANAQRLRRMTVARPQVWNDRRGC